MKIMSDWDDDEIDEPQQNKTPVPTYQNYNSRVYRPSSGRGSGRGHNSNINWRVGETSREENNRTRRNDDRKKRVILVPSQKVGRIIGKGGSKIRDLENESGAKIQIGSSYGNDSEVTLIGPHEAISKVDDMIKELITDRPSPQEENINTSESSSNSGKFMTINERGHEVLDWAKLYAAHDQTQNEKWSKLSPIVKDFYKEDPKVSSMTPAEVTRWRHANNDIQVKRTFDNKPDLRPIPNPVLTFEQAFKHYPEILQEIYKQGFTTPSPIQSQAWPVLLRGDDLIGIAQTGTGKTLAFLLPALIHIEGQIIPKEERKGPSVLILAPTRELALQIDKEVSKYQYRGIKSVCLYGGTSRRDQVRILTKGVDIVIATPGRLNDLVLSRDLEIINFSYIVLDEADRMLDMGFEPQIRISLFDVRPDRQTIMTSATWPTGVHRLAEFYMKNPIQVNVGSLDLAAVHTVTQKIMFVEEHDKQAVLFDFLHNMEPTDKVIIFCGKKAMASYISSELSLKGIESQCLHGDREQSDREAALEDMVDGTVNILVATDVASRGIDIKDLTHVINLDFPRHIEEYVHRVGRTGRAGKTGIALSFISRNDWTHARELIKILEEANQDVPDELEQMAQRFEAMNLKREQSGRGGRGRGRGGGGRRDRW